MVDIGTGVHNAGSLGGKDGSTSPSEVDVAGAVGYSLTNFVAQR